MSQKHSGNASTEGIALRILLWWVQGGNLMVCYLSDVVSQLELRDLQTAALKKKLPMPGLGSVASFSGRRQDTQLFFNFTGFTEPGAIYQYAPPPLLRSTLCTMLQSLMCSTT